MGHPQAALWRQLMSLSKPTLANAIELALRIEKHLAYEAYSTTTEEAAELSGMLRDIQRQKNLKNQHDAVNRRTAR
jgi:hypothetical protein